MENDTKEKLNEIPSEEQVQAIKTTEFMMETIKQRPINKKKLLRKLLLTIGLALIFGLVACLTFLILEPIIDERVNPKVEEEVESVHFREESEEEETKIQDMIADETELVQQNIVPPETVPLDEEQIEQVLNRVELGTEDLMSLNQIYRDVASEVSRSLVKVVAITQDTDWLANTVSAKDTTSGVIVADNGRDYLILADVGGFEKSSELEVEFGNGEKVSGKLLVSDKPTGLGIIAVTKISVTVGARDAISIVEMGTSANRDLNGTPVIALGRPMGMDDSLGIGYISSCNSVINLPDGNYKRLTTDISGSKQASGFLINTKGQLLGIIDMDYCPSDMPEVICGIGISELKRMIEKMSNGQTIPYLGIYGTDVTDDIAADMAIPQGVYISELEMDSPLLNAGIQSGDIITSVYGNRITNFADFNNQRLLMEPEKPIPIKVKRQAPEGYTELSFEIELAKEP